MKRRSALAVLAAGLAGLAGCQRLGADADREPYDVPPTEAAPESTTRGDPTTDGAPPTPGEPASSLDATPSLAPPEGLRRAVTHGLDPDRRLLLVGHPLADVPFGGRLVAGFLEPPTADSPARIWVGFANTLGRPERFQLGPTPPLSQYWAVDRRGGNRQRVFLLVPDDDALFPYRDVVPDGPTDGRWVATGPLGRPETIVEQHETELDAGQSVSGTYHLLVHPDAGVDRRRNVYAFAESNWSALTLGLAVDAATYRLPPATLDPGPVPPLPLPVDGTRWYHRVAGSGSPPAVYARPTAEHLSIGEETTIRLHNRSVRMVIAGGQFLFKLSDAGWAPIGGVQRADHDGRIPPAGAFDIHLIPRREAIRPGRPADGTTTAAATAGAGDDAPVVGRTTLAVGGLGPGLYAVHAGTANERRDPVGPDAPLSVEATRPAPHGVSTAVAVALRLDGDPVAVTPTTDVTETSTDGDTVTVRVAAASGASRPATLVVERTPLVNPRTLITEQVLQFPALRNALARFEPGVETVRVRTSEKRASDPVFFFTLQERLTFAFEGETFEAILDSRGS